MSVFRILRLSCACVALLVARGSAEPVLSLSELATYEQHALTHDGDAERGRALFRDEKQAKCGVCHKAEGQGGEAGPDLSHIAGKFDRPHLIESLLEPSRQIVEGYRTTVVETKSGRVETGIVKAHNENELTLVNANGQKVVIPQAEIAAREESITSLMPEGLQKLLSADQFTDVIAYLETLRPGGRLTPGAGISGGIKLPDGFEVHTLATGLTGLTALETINDGRLFVCEQNGALRVIKQGKLLESPFVTIPVEMNWERGLIGVTVHPDFPRTPYVYVCYVVKEPFTHHRVSRFTADGDVAVPGSEKILLEGDDQSKMGGKVPAGHQGGALHFGLDGKLYIAIGEQTAGEPSQNLDTFLGKILRIEPDGGIPADNPFVSQTAGKYRAIWARGLRNPFTFAIRKPDGAMCINDIGQDKFEEVNRGFAGANYGWPISEGPTDDPRFVGPIHSYSAASVCAADFAPAELSWPAKYIGRFFFADYIHGWLKTLDPDHPDQVETFATGLRRPVDFRFSVDGSLYILLRNAWVVDGKFQPGTGSILQIRHVARQQVALAEPAVTRGAVTLDENAIDASADNLPSYKIVTPLATYYLEKSGAGLSSMLDKDGNDWLGFHPKPGSGSAGEYRGFPNAVFKEAGSYFHARNSGTEPSTTKVEYSGTDRVTIAAVSSNGLWECRYDFFPTHCTFTMTKMPAGHKYWVLYEGVPGGQYDDDDWWMTSAVDKKAPLTTTHEGDIPTAEWMAFGDPKLQRAIVLAHHEDDAHPDKFYEMRKEMTVFGFGRLGMEKFISTVPQRFSIGFVEEGSHATIGHEVGAWFKSEASRPAGQTPAR